MYIEVVFKWVRVGGTIAAPTARVQMMGSHILGFWGLPAFTFSLFPICSPRVQGHGDQGGVSYRVLNSLFYVT